MDSFYKFSIVLLVLSISVFVNGQSRNGLYGFTEPGTSSIILTGAGVGYMFGDLGETKKIMSDHIGIMPTLSYKYTFPNNIGFKLSLMYGRFKHTDYETSNNARDYSSDIKLGSAAFHFEYNFFGGQYAEYPSYHTFYTFLGIGAVYSDVLLTSRKNYIKDEFLGKKVKMLNNYQAQTYTWSPIIPIGLGYEYELSSNWAVGAEYTMQIPFSDYMDGISPSGSNHFDYLMSLSFSITYKFGYSPTTTRRWNY